MAAGVKLFKVESKDTLRLITHIIRRSIT